MNITKSLQDTMTQRATAPAQTRAFDIRKTFAAKSGKANTTSGPQISNIQEQQAAADVASAATDQQQQAQMQVGQQNLAQQSQDQQMSQQQQQISQQAQQISQKFEQQKQQVANQLDRVGKDIESAEAKDTLAQAIFTRRLADDQYINKLMQDASLDRLEDQQNFQIAAGQAAFGNQMELFRDKADFAAMLEMDEATFQKELAKMDINTAKQVLDTQMKSANTTSQYNAVGSFASKSIEAGTTKYKGEDGQDTTFFKQMTS